MRAAPVTRYAREEEVGKAGDYLAFSIMGEPVLVVRDQDGALAHNAVNYHLERLFAAP